jgi:hypothetical protein
LWEKEVGEGEEVFDHQLSVGGGERVSGPETRDGDLR